MKRPLRRNLTGINSIHLILLVLVLLATMGTVVFATGEQYARQRYRPLRGGIQIEQWKWYWFIPVPYGTCTIGYVAEAPDGTLGVITAGHCTRFETDVSVYQPSLSLFVNNYIGNPSWVAPTSSSNYYDVEFIPNSDVRPSVLYATNTGASFISVGYYLDFSIVRNLIELFGPIPVNKTGRTTGTTGGYITDALDPYNVTLNGVPTIIRYALITSLHALGGDSSAPVFRYEPRIGAVLYGHVVASNLDPNNPLAIVQSVEVILEYGYVPKLFWR
jgi:hypothetical protein